MNGKEMFFAYSKSYKKYALIIDGINYKCSEKREVVENLFNRLCKNKME